MTPAAGTPAAGTPAVGKTRTVFVSAFEPRTHAVLSGCVPALSSCFPGQGESPGASPTHRSARKAELCSFGFSGVSLICQRFAARRAAKPASSQKKGEIGERAQAFSLRTETLEKLSFAPWLFKRFPYLPAVCGPKGRLSRPAARGKGRSAAGHWNGVQRGEAPLRIFVYFLFGRK